MAGTSVAPTRLAMIYVDNAAAAALSLDLVPTEAGANVWLLEPYDEVVFERTRRKSVTMGATIANVAQLMTSGPTGSLKRRLIAQGTQAATSRSSTAQTTGENGSPAQPRDTS